MKKIGLLILFLAFSTTAFSQQFLWSTVKNAETKYVPVEYVPYEVLKFYDFYEYYYDGIGYNKEGFFNSFENSESFKYANSDRWDSLKKKINKIDTLTVVAFRSNLGNGSSVVVMCIDKENVDIVTFSNVFESNAIFTLDRKKFLKWFKTILQ